MRPFLRFLKFPVEERRALLWLLPLLLAARLLLKPVGVPALRRGIGLVAPRLAPTPERLAELLNVAAQRLPGFTACLPRAIVLEALLRRAGRSAELRIGLAPLREAKRLDAHAWVELDGIALAENVSGYTALPVFGVRG